MKLSDLFRSAIGAAKAEGIAIEQEPSDDAVLAGLLNTPTQAETAQLRQQVADLLAAQRRAAATAFADAAVRDRRALPAERDTLAALHLQAADDDAARPAAASRVAQLESAVRARAPHALGAEQVGAGPLVALAADAAAEDWPVQKQRLLSMTPVGRAALAGAKEK